MLDSPIRGRGSPARSDDSDLEREPARCSWRPPRSFKESIEASRLQLKILRRCLAVISRLQLIAPFVQQPAIHAEFFRERDNVVADTRLPFCTICTKMTTLNASARAARQKRIRIGGVCTSKSVRFYPTPKIKQSHKITRIFAFERRAQRMECASRCCLSQRLL